MLESLWPVQTRGDKVAVRLGIGFLVVAFALDFAVGLGLQRPPVWAATGVLVGLAMLATAAAVDRLDGD